MYICFLNDMDPPINSLHLFINPPLIMEVSYKAGPIHPFIDGIVQWPSSWDAPHDDRYGNLRNPSIIIPESHDNSINHYTSHMNPVKNPHKSHVNPI